MLTVMTTEDDNDENHAIGSFDKDPVTSEMIHYTEGGKRSNLSVNCGVYLIAADLFHDAQFMQSLRGKPQMRDQKEQKANLAKL